MSTTITKKAITNVTLQQAEEASKTLAEKVNQLEKIKVKMNELVDKVKNRYSDQVTELREEVEEATKILEQYAYEQKSSWDKKKSFELPHNIIGFRTGTPRVTKEKKFSWEAVLELLKKNKAFKRFIRTKEEINKEAILSLNAANEKEKQLLLKLKDECYLFIEQGDAFYIMPKKEEVAI
jgi:phage host-nuclease inhibitor protein Gam